MKIDSANDSKLREVQAGFRKVRGSMEQIFAIRNIIEQSLEWNCPLYINRPFSKMAAENSNRSILKTHTSTRKKTFTLVSLPSFSISGVISAEKI